MEQLNRANEEDTRSLASRKSGSSGSPKGHEPSLAEDDEEDLWSVWGEVIRNWEVEVKKNPNSIKTLVKRGIPQHFRTIAWQLLSNASVSSIHEVYSDYMRQSSVYEKVWLSCALVILYVAFFEYSPRKAFSRHTTLSRLCTRTHQYHVGKIQNLNSKSTQFEECHHKREVYDCGRPINLACRLTAKWK
ncbi:hypothetical protein ANCCAN_04292 [Ancylostoma caninum]|uniref:Rab-GAP TBC domain-containing protein n=1 Tax=Ancylostoma caninum TaxID=29170 RepID=A0A368H1M2_ANCCA|nr:hypothetical protein ANCCAN_04292 [Ancylostoma caninum]